MAAARLVTLGAALSLVLPTALASSGADYRALRARDYQLADSVLESRQEMTPERFQCHSDCGNSILDAEVEGYCDSEAWQGLLESCLECVGEYPIWQHYRDPVQAAASACGLEATPTAVAVPSEGEATPTRPPTATGSSGGDDQEVTPSPTVTAPATSASASDVEAEETGVPASAVRATGSFFAVGVFAAVAVLL
ncbi:hypothetical protein F5X68DRAFT_47113 [Plectosphaerella plurivora]|uniref:Uncharacterized protein n=1 Tax=Plectosphaerella plurivora TaxID=936078 RepID=A0A9P8VKE2_9PEZI|nr:hypothetical protein F5X68DRAFT_47113 [Plectosphaerella plurivora]